MFIKLSEYCDRFLLYEQIYRNVDPSNKKNLAVGLTPYFTINLYPVADTLTALFIIITLKKHGFHPQKL